MNLDEAQSMNATIAAFMTGDDIDLSKLVESYPKDTSAQRQWTMLLTLRTAKQVEDQSDLLKGHQRELTQQRRVLSLLVSGVVFVGSQYYDVDLTGSIIGALVSLILPNAKSLAGFLLKPFVS